MDVLHRWCVVLAGGDGVRLRPLTRLICGEDRPKQFCPILPGAVSLLQRTRQRVLRSVAAEQTLFALTRVHRKFYMSELGGQESQRIVQPANRGTAPPILYSLLSITSMDREALIAIMPCDHYFSDEALFTAALETAFDIAAEQPSSATLLAARPSYAETEYGWIETAPTVGTISEDIFRVRTFHEKPPAGLADALFRRGALWNTFVMIGHVRALLAIIQAARPDLFAALSGARLWTGGEIHIEDSVYEQMMPADFSAHVLAANAARLIALRLGPMVWSDLGNPDRTLAALSRETTEPAWVDRWRQVNAVHSSAVAAVGAV